MGEKEHNHNQENWDLVINSKAVSGKVNWKEIIRYWDLLLLFVKRDFISLYKQTVLGLLWVVIQPILTTITYYIIFTKVANVDTGAIPPILFYILGVTVWTYFADCLIKTSDTFILNQNIFGKVYFPRIVIPLSLVLTNLIKFGLQFGVFVIIYFYYVIFEGLWDGSTGPSWHLLLIPFLILLLAVLGLGFGLIISGLTTKYRDLRFLIQFGIQLMMFATPIVWPLNLIPQEYRVYAILNPMASIVETFKAAFFNIKDPGAITMGPIFEWSYLIYSALFAFLVLFIGLRLFSRVEKSFIDTI